MALGVCGLGLYQATQSSMFIVRVVEVSDPPEYAPVDARTLTDLANIPLGRLNLFNLNLEPIEARILTLAWVRSVTLQKRFPQTLAITVVFREPRALLQSESGKLSYVDVDGKVFGEVNLNKQPDLPILTGIPTRNPDAVRSALKVLERWDSAQLGRVSQISSLGYDPERGYRAWVSYPMVNERGRTLVELGQEFDADFDEQLQRLGRVIRYLAGNGIAVRQIWADAGKKIVVKIAHRS